LRPKDLWDEALKELLKENKKFGDAYEKFFQELLFWYQQVHQ